MKFAASLRRAFVVVCSAVTVQATTVTYNSTTNNSSLATGTNWSGGAVPTTSDEALFTTAAPGNLVTTAANSVFGDLVWATNNTTLITINTSGSTNRTLTLSGGGGSTEAIARGGASGDLIVMGTAASTNTLSFIGNIGAGTARLSVVLGSSGNFNVVNSTATLNVAVTVSGANSLTKTGAGVLNLTGNNTFGGGSSSFTLSAGTVNVGTASAFGNSTNTVALNGGTVDNVSGGSLTMNNYAQTWGGNFAFTGTNALNLGAGAVTLSGGNRTVTVNGSTLTVGGAIGDGGNGRSLTKSGAGILALSGNNTFSGGTIVSAGTLSAGHNNALGSGSASVTGGTLSVASGITLSNNITVGSSGAVSGAAASSTLAGTVSGTGTLSGSLAVSGNLSPGTSPGTLTNTGLLSLANTSVYNWELAALSTTNAGTDFDQILNNAGTISITSGAAINLILGSFAPSADSFWSSNKTWTVISSSNGGSITGSALAVSNNQSGWSSYGTFSTAILGSDLQLTWTVAAIPEPSTYAAFAGLVTLLGVVAHRRRRAAAAAAEAAKQA